MKIRNGFVSNSSSSSFIVAFSVLPKTVEELQSTLFGTEKVYPNPYIFNNRDPYGWSVEEVAATVWKDLQENGTISRSEAIELGLSGYLEDAEYPPYPNYLLSPEERKSQWDEYEEKRSLAAKTVVDKFLSTVPEEFVLVRFEYSDNDGAYYTALEHGPLFMKVKHLRISNH